MVARGRAISPIRPGILIKRVLMGEFPLSTGAHVTEAAITDIHSAYRDFVNQVNQTRARDRQLKPMNHSSFYTLFKFVRLLGLVELVREEPMLSPPPTGSLFIIRVRKEPPPTRASAIRAVRRIFKLTEVGMQDERAWLDLTRAWKENFSIPQAVEHFPTLEELVASSTEREREKEVEREEKAHEARKRRGGRPAKVAKEVKEAEEEERAEEEIVKLEPSSPIPAYKRVQKPSKRQFTLLLNHLLKLEQLDLTRSDVIKHIGLVLETVVADWGMDAEDRLSSAESAGKIARVNELTVEKQALDRLYEAVLDRDLGSAIAILKELVASS